MARVIAELFQRPLYIIYDLVGQKIAVGIYRAVVFEVFVLRVITQSRKPIACVPIIIPAVADEYDRTEV